MVFQGSDGSYQHDCFWAEPGALAFDIHELFCTKVRPEPCFGDDVICQGEACFGSDDRVSALGDIGEGSTMDNCWESF